MTKKNFTLGIISLMAVILSSCDNGPLIAEHKTRVALIFSDVTSSLIPEENKEVATLTADVLKRLPSGTIYAVYPIQVETQRLNPIKEGKVVAENNEQAGIAVEEKRRQDLIDAIARLYQDIRKVKDRGATYGKPDNHTCILNTLSFAEAQFRQFSDRAKYDLELIFISDMVEECNRTPLRQPIVLARKDISNEIKLAENADLKFNLPDVRVTVIVPSTPQTYTVGQRPNLEDVRLFWENIFKHCGFNDDSLKDEKQFYFSAGLPQRFKSETE